MTKGTCQSCKVTVEVAPEMPKQATGFCARCGKTTRWVREDEGGGVRFERADAASVDGAVEYEVRLDGRLLGVLFKDDGYSDWTTDFIEGDYWVRFNEAKAEIRRRLEEDQAIAAEVGV